MRAFFAWLGLIAFVVVACGSTPDAPKCSGGSYCACDGFCAETCKGSGKGCQMECVANSKCNFDCPGGSCFYKCGAGSTCNLKCAGGNCSAQCDGSATCTIDCGGNNCSLTCRGTPTCRVNACTKFCDLDCGGAQICETTCSPAPGGCNKTP